MDKYIVKMLEYFQKMTFTDILGFGNILGVKEEEDFADYVTNILETYSLQPRRKRKQLLQLAKDVAGANKDIKKIETTPKQDTV